MNQITNDWEVCEQAISSDTYEELAEEGIISSSLV
jgi:hypothetical protein